LAVILDKIFPSLHTAADVSSQEDSMASIEMLPPAPLKGGFWFELISSWIILKRLFAKKGNNFFC
jgi:hypothetical protein